MRVICFDIGGVLVRICRSWKEAAELAGLPVRAPKQLLTEAWRARRSAVVDRYQRGQLCCEDYYVAMSEAVEGVYSPEEVRQIHHVWTVEEYAGVSQLIDELNRIDGLTTACLSNTNHAHWTRLDPEGQPPEFPSVPRLRQRLASHLLGLTKPDERIFEQAQASFSCAPQEVLFFDDLEDNVHAARHAGWTAERIDHQGATAEQMREHLARHGLPL